MKSLTDSLAAAARRGSQAADAARRELISLLQAKVLVKEALNADAVKAAHPELNASLDRYIELYGEQKRGEGSAAALADVTAVSDYLLGKKTANDLTGIWARYAEEDPALVLPGRAGPAQLAAAVAGQAMRPGEDRAACSLFLCHLEILG